MDDDEDEPVPPLVSLEDADADPIVTVVNAAHAGNLSQDHLQAANVIVSGDAETLSELVLEEMSELIANSWPEPSTSEDLKDILVTATENVSTTHSTTPGELGDAGDEDTDYDAGDALPPLPNAPPNETCRCETIQSGRDVLSTTRGGLILRIHFFFGSGNIEIRATEGGVKRGDVVAMESIYALWMTEDTVNMVLSCPTTSRKLVSGRWREASELSSFPANNPSIKVQVNHADVEAASAAVSSCRRMHKGILDEPERVPQDFNADVLKTRAAQYRAAMVTSRLPPHITAFVIRSDPNASEAEHAAASAMISSLLRYCNKYWQVYVDTILTKKRSHGFPLRCLSCGDKTRWMSSSGLRVGSDGVDHQYCKKFRSSITNSMKRMLVLPTIHTGKDDSHQT